MLDRLFSHFGVQIPGVSKSPKVLRGVTLLPNTHHITYSLSEAIWTSTNRVLLASSCVISCPVEVVAIPSCPRACVCILFVGMIWIISWSRKPPKLIQIKIHLSHGQPSLIAPVQQLLANHTLGKVSEKMTRTKIFMEEEKNKKNILLYLGDFDWLTARLAATIIRWTPRCDDVGHYTLRKSLPMLLTITCWAVSFCTTLM